MSGEWKLTSEEFEELLSWLDPDRERAGRKYEEIRARLIKMFRLRGRSAAEDLADKTLDRVVKRLPEIRETYEGKPESYFFGVAKHIVQEDRRREGHHQPFDRNGPVDAPDLTGDGPDEELYYDCLDKCLGELTPVQCEMVRQYHANDSPAERKALARRLGITLETLRVKVFRIMKVLKPCVEKCVGRGGAG